MLSLYLLRHGETEFSRDERFCGRIDAPLTAGGREMAARFASAYGALDWRAILTSTRIRTIESATPLARRTGLVVEADARLDEMFYGEWQGLSKAEVAARDGDYFARWQRDPSIGPPLGESPHAVSARALAAIHDLLGRHAEGPVLIVSHKALLRILLCQLFGIELRHYRRGAWPAGAVTEVELCAGGPSLRRFADVEHLTSLDASDDWTPPRTAASV
ncbi:MAG TPA: histidine phosphatase family protein [Polyangia bacterium]|jgi:probable phosphoglycerate mutase